MRKNIVMAGLAATLLSISAAGAFADSAPPVVLREGRLGVVQENVAAGMERVRMGVDDHKISHREALALDTSLLAIRHAAARDASHGGITTAEYHNLLGRIDAISQGVKFG